MICTLSGKGLDELRQDFAWLYENFKFIGGGCAVVR